MYAVKQPTTASLKSPAAVDRRVTGSGNYVRVGKARVPGSGTRFNRHGSVRAVISGGDKAAVEAATPLQSKGVNGLSSSSGGGEIPVKAVVTIRKKMKEKIIEKIEDQWEFFVNGIGQGILIQLISEQVDPVTNAGKSVQSAVRGWLPKPVPSEYANIVEYAADFKIPSDFGCPGAIMVSNLRGKESYLLEIVIHGFDGGPIFFPANSRKVEPRKHSGEFLVASMIAARGHYHHRQTSSLSLSPIATRSANPGKRTFGEFFLNFLVGFWNEINLGVLNPSFQRTRECQGIFRSPPTVLQRTKGEIASGDFLNPFPHNSTATEYLT